MKLSITFRKSIVAVLLLLLMSGVYGAVIALCNQYLRGNNLLTPVNKFILITMLVVGYYLIYKWFYKRINLIAKKYDGRI